MTDKLQDIVSGNFKQVIVSTEIATSTAFRKSALSKPQFTSKLRCVGIDEAHCVSLWGGSFWPDYADLGVLRRRIPSNVPFVVASATLPKHVLDDVRLKLGLSKNATRISLTNARPNFALSVRTMQHPEESKADLPRMHADALRRREMDEGIPPECIAFYHAKIGQAQKRNFEERLRNGEIHILFCTDAVGMRAGRAARDLTKFDEAILIVPGSVLKSGVTELDIELSVNTASKDAESENRGTDETAALSLEGIEVTAGLEEVSIADGGIRVSKDSDDEDGEADNVKHKRRKKLWKDCNSREAQFLSRFAVTNKCRRKIWDEFFQNASKFANPGFFEVEQIKINKVLELNEGERRRCQRNWWFQSATSSQSGAKIFCWIRSIPTL
ncbi:hypothetical protein FB451DRAFT_1178991 [Mycena latifolia]|nr:hypothetical protein FB451DRAFT_1178991 [Mycena latifolia]